MVYLKLVDVFSPKKFSAAKEILLVYFVRVNSSMPPEGFEPTIHGLKDRRDDRFTTEASVYFTFFARR